MIEVLFAQERDVAAWSAAHRRGEKPGLWPYGLEELVDIDPDARIGALSQPSRLDAVRARLFGRLRSSPRPDPERPPIGLTWDENAARRMALTSPHDSMFTGVIWITDLAARGGDTGRMRDVLRRMDGLWVISRGQLEPLRAFVGQDGPPIGYFRFGVDADFFARQPYPTEPLVLSVGGDRDRDTATLFAALAEVHDRVPYAQLVVQTSSSMTPPDGVTTVSHVDHVELRDLYGRASVVAIATRQNLHASGMTVSLEAQATGRPVVVTRTPGIEDYVDHDRTGLLTPVGDPMAMAQAIERLLADQGLAKRLGAAGRKAVEDSMTTAHMVEGLAAFLGLRDPASQQQHQTGPIA